MLHEMSQNALPSYNSSPNILIYFLNFIEASNTLDNSF